MFDRPVGFVTLGQTFKALEQKDDASDTLSVLVESFAGRTPEQIEAAQARAIDTLQSGLPPESGTTAMEHVYGQWPGDEIDEQVAQALEDLS